MANRDYSLLGADGARAVDTGLAAAEWYHSEVPRKVIKELMQRSDGPAIRDSIILYGTMIALAAAGIVLWPSWWSVPFFLAYAVLYGSASDSRWHECGHGTAFKTGWMNDVVYHIASFMVVRNPYVWRWSHARHHTDTYIVGRDPEIAIMRPSQLLKFAGLYFGLPGVLLDWVKMLRYAFTGKVGAEEATFIPATEHSKVIFVARIWTVIYAATFVLAYYLGSILPFLVIGLPRLYGGWQHVMVGLLQHGGLADNVNDHRLNSRTVIMGPVNRFIYWNMNYHLEHHMFPMVPYHALPRLHDLIKDDLPAPTMGIIAAYREMWPILKRQLRNEEVFIKRQLPPTARPYREDFHVSALGAAIAAE
jgi:fatty acid desaturase